MTFQPKISRLPAMTHLKTVKNRIISKKQLKPEVVEKSKFLTKTFDKFSLPQVNSITIVTYYGEKRRKHGEMPYRSP